MNSPRHTGLGRGLGDLLQRTDPTPPNSPEQSKPVAGARFEELALEVIRPNPKQPRSVFDEEALAELVASISGGRAPPADRGAAG